MSLFSYAERRSTDDVWGLPKDLGLRWYQEEAVDGVEAALRQHRSTLLEMATGLGKTQCFGALIARWKGNVLVLAHRDELVEQARQRIEQMTGEWVEVEKADLYASTTTRIVVGSVQSLQRKRLQRFKPSHFTLIVVDEGHHATAPSYRTILDYFSDAKVLGVTATPDRGDKRALGLVFDSVAYRFGIVEGIEQGYLVPVKGQRVYLEQIDLSGVSVSQGDLAVGQLDEVMLKAVEGVVRKTLELEPHRQAVCFFPGVKSAEYAALKFNELRPESAIMISGKTDADERQALVRDYKKARYQYLCNCMVATEGFDAPAANLIVLARPTKSRSLYAQMVGRGTRVLPNVVDHIPGKEYAQLRRIRIGMSAKPDVVILDFVGNSGKHSLASIEDVLGGQYTDDEKKRAKKKITDRAVDTREALEQARKELAKIAARAKAKIQARTERFDPFRVLGIQSGLEQADKYAQRFGHKAIDKSQRSRLLKLGYKDRDLEGLGRAHADRLLAEATRRMRLGLASYKQLRALERYGVARADLTFEAARAGMTYLYDQQFRNIDPKELDRRMSRVRQPGEDG